MIPARVSFHDAVITGIATGPSSVALSLESVTAENGNLVTGWLRFDGITALTCDDEPIAEFAMAGETGEVLTLEQGEAGKFRLFVLWSATYGGAHRSYIIECRRADWLQREEQ